VFTPPLIFRNRNARRGPLVQNPADPLPDLGRVLASRIFLDQLCCSEQNPSMKRHGRSLHFGAAFVGVIPHAVFVGKLPRAAQ